MIVLASALALSACAADSAELEDAVDDATETVVEQAEDATDTTLSPGTAEAVAKLQTSLDAVTNELEDADQDVVVAWEEIQARVSDAVVEVQADPDFDPSGVESMFEAFEMQMSAMDVGAGFDTAWSEFRTDFETFVEAAA